MPTHTNLCAHGTDVNDLHKIWDNDLKKCINRRRVYEALALIWAFVAIPVLHPSTAGYVAPLAFLLYMAVIQFIDESNVNYLMHAWELREAEASFARWQS